MKKKNKKEQIEDLVKTILGGYAKDGTANATHIKGKDRDDYAAAKVSLTGAGAVGESFDEFGNFGVKEYLAGKKPEENKTETGFHIVRDKPKPVSFSEKIKKMFIRNHSGFHVMPNQTNQTNEGHEPDKKEHKIYYRDMGKSGVHGLEYAQSKDVEEEKDDDMHHGLWVRDYAELPVIKLNENIIKESIDDETMLQHFIDIAEKGHEHHFEKYRDHDIFGKAKAFHDLGRMTKSQHNRFLAAARINGFKDKKNKKINVTHDNTTNTNDGGGLKYTNSHHAIFDTILKTDPSSDTHKSLVHSVVNGVAQYKDATRITDYQKSQIEELAGHFHSFPGDKKELAKRLRSHEHGEYYLNRINYLEEAAMLTSKNIYQISVGRLGLKVKDHHTGLHDENVDIVNKLLEIPKKEREEHPKTKHLLSKFENNCKTMFGEQDAKTIFDHLHNKVIKRRTTYDNNFARELLVTPEGMTPEQHRRSLQKQSNYVTNIPRKIEPGSVGSTFAAAAAAAKQNKDVSEATKPTYKERHSQIVKDIQKFSDETDLESRIKLRVLHDELNDHLKMSEIQYNARNYDNTNRGE